MIPEAPIGRTDTGLVPEGPGWYVLNAREARWWHSDELGSYCPFEGDERFPDLGLNINLLHPGQPNCMYHGENAQEDFLVLAGECVLVIEGEERRLGPWDFVHCPPWTEHVFVGAGTEPCVLLAVGARPPEEAIRYPVEEAARRHGAGVDEETGSPEQAYAPFPRPVKGEYRDGDLP
jgi:uncharacterized cupin superfamily protein